MESTGQIRETATQVIRKVGIELRVSLTLDRLLNKVKNKLPFGITN